MLMDMNGDIVHVWKNVRGIGRMQLLRNGNLVVISRGVAELMPESIDVPMPQDSIDIPHSSDEILTQD
jgi:hypothetical protein